MKTLPDIGEKVRDVVDGAEGTVVGHRWGMVLVQYEGAVAPMLREMDDLEAPL